MFNFFITQKAPRNGPLLLGSHWLLKFSFNFFSVIFCSLHVEEKTGTKMKKECGAGWRRGPWQRHPRHSPLPANPAPTQWYVLTRCHGMPATCRCHRRARSQFTRRRKEGHKNEKENASWMAPWTLAAAPTAQPPTCKSGNNPVVRAHKMPWHRQGKRKEAKNKTCEPDGFVDRQLGI